MKFCGSSKGDELDRQFASLSISSGNSHSSPFQPNAPKSAQQAPPSSSGLTASKYATQPPPPPPATSTSPTLPSVAETTNGGTTPSPELQLILSATRKLREAIIASHRTDAFAQRAYVFIIRAAILCRSWESYHPAILYLLHTIHPITPLPDSDLKDFVGYRILDEACRLGDLAEANRVRVGYSLKYGWARDDGKMRRVNKVLEALVRDDWCVFWRMKRAVDGYQRRLMEWAEEGVRVHALKCLGRSYFSAERTYVERCAGMEWKELVRQGVGWELQADGEGVVIRRVKAKGGGSGG